MASEERHPGDKRRIVKDPSGRNAGLAVTSNYNPGPHETKYVVEQLRSPSGGEDAGRAEPVYVGDREDALHLIQALSEVLRRDE